MHCLPKKIVFIKDLLCSNEHFSVPINPEEINAH